MTTSGSLVDIQNEDNVLENIPIEEVFQQLKCSRKGLSSAEGENRLQIFGPNKLEKKKENKILKLLGFMWNPLPWVMEAAALMAAVLLANGDGKPPESLVCFGIICLLLFNSIRNLIEENNAEVATAALMACLSPKTKLLRDGKWSEQEASILVPGDIVSIKLGDIIPCDARLLEGDTLKVDQSTITGESIPITKSQGERVFSGSTCTQGEMVAVVIATGVHTFFHKASHLVDNNTNQVEHFKKLLTKLGNFCIVSIAIGLWIEVVVMFPIQRRNYRDVINNMLVLLIGGIPISMPIVMSLMMSIGSWRLFQQGAIAKRMTTIEELASMDVLITDKTGTLTLNKLSVDKTVPEKPKESLFPLFDPPKHDGEKTIRRALNLGVNVKMTTGDELAIAKETGLKLGMGTKIYSSTSLLGQNKDESIARFHVDELIKEADGFADVLPEHKYEIVKKLQERKHICGMTSNGLNDALALKKADIGIAFADATEAERVASDIILIEPGLNVIINAVQTSRATLQLMKSYAIYVVSIPIRVVFGFMLIALIWKFDISPLMVLIIVILNDGTILTISKDKVKPSPKPDSLKFKEIFATGVVLGGYMALVTIVFFWTAYKTDFFPRMFNVRDLRSNEHEMMSALYLQVSIMSQALIFVIRSRSWSFIERPGLLLVCDFMAVQMTATIIAVYASWNVGRMEGIGLGWAGVIWLYNIIFYFPLDILKFAIRYLLTGKAWHKLIDNKLWHSRRINDDDDDELLVKLC